MKKKSVIAINLCLIASIVTLFGNKIYMLYIGDCHQLWEEAQTHYVNRQYEKARELLEKIAHIDTAHHAQYLTGDMYLKAQGKQHHEAAQPEKAGSRVCAAGIRKGKVLRAVQGSQGRTAQTENRKAECCVLFPGGRTDAAGEIKECAYDQSEDRPGVPVPDSPSDR